MLDRTSNLLQAIRAFVLGQVHCFADSVRLHPFSRENLQSWCKTIILGIRVGPKVVMFFVQDQGHSIVNLSDQGIGFGGEDAHANELSRRPDGSPLKKTSLGTQHKIFAANEYSFNKLLASAKKGS